MDAVLNGKHIVIAECSAGKTVCGISWAKATGKPKVLVVTTASVRDAKGYEKEAVKWYQEWYTSLSLFSVVSWAGLAAWTHANWSSLDEYAFIFDEVAACKGAGNRGKTSQQGKAFLQITHKTDCWTGWTATPAENWEDCCAYLIAGGKVRNKTQFYNQYVISMTHPFPKTLGYRNESELEQMWGEVKHNVDASSVLAELPPETHEVIEFKTPTGYKQVAKTSTTLDGEFIDSNPKYQHYLRQICCTKQKLQWVKDFVAHLGTRAVIFYSYKDEGDRLEETVAKALPKGARVWRIDGAHHDIPDADTCGERDVVLTQWQSGSFGLNLQFINYWVSMTPTYSFSTSVQARKRIKRIGQENICHYYYLKCVDTIEEEVYKALKNKSDFAERVWGTAQQQKYKFNWREEKKNEG